MLSTPETAEAGRLVLRDVRKQYPNGFVAVHDANLDLEPGELVVFLGPSGCGKTTTLRMIAGLESITEGTITFGDRNIGVLPPEQRNVSMVFQDLALYPHMTVRENIAFPLRARRHKRGLSKAEIQSRVVERVEMVGLSELIDRRVSMLSGGQRQRVALARALVREPIIFLLDEAFASLDAVLRREFWTEFKRFQRKIGITMIHVTHDQEEAMMMADRIVVFSEGQIVQVGTPDEIFDRPATRFVARFVGSPPINVLPLEVVERDGRAVAAGLGVEVPLDETPSLPAGTELALGIRPQRVRWGRGGPHDVELAVRVTIVESVGTHRIMYCQLADVPEFEITCVVHDEQPPAEGDSGWVRFPLSSAILFEGRDESAPARSWPDPSVAVAS